MLALADIEQDLIKTVHFNDTVTDSNLDALAKRSRTSSNIDKDVM